MNDLRFGLRMLRRTPGFTAAALVCLALGIGATTAIFSVVNAVVMRPLPYASPERLVRVYSEFTKFPGGGLRRFWISRPEYLELRRDSASWESLDAWATGGANLAGADEPVRVTASFITGGLLPSLGVQPRLGRLLTPEDDRPGEPRTAVISEGLWKRAFGADPAVLGRDARLEGRTCTIVGVMPAGFSFPPGEPDAAEIWTPLQIDPANPGGRANHSLSVVGRLRPNVPPARAQDELSRLVRRYGERRSENFHSLDPENHPIISFGFQDEVVRGVRPAVLALLAAVGFVLLIACVNVANLLLARAEARQREIAIRQAIGAGRGALVRQFFVEGWLLSLAGAALGLAFAYAGLQLIVTAAGNGIPRAEEIGIDHRVLLFTLGVAAGTGLFFGMAPLFPMAARSLSETLKAAAGRATATAGANRMRKALAAGELALALVLLIATGLMVQAFWRLQTVDLGIRQAGLLTMRIGLPAGAYQEGPRVTQLWASLQERLASLAGVESASIAEDLPPARSIDANDTEIEGLVLRPGGPIHNVDYYQTAGGRYFETMGVRLIEGRFFDERDGEGAPPALIVNETFARTFYPGQSAIGRRVRPGFEDPWRTIVGVVADVKNAGIDKPAGTELYLPYRQTGGSGMRNPHIVVRAAGDPMSLARAVRAEIRALDASLTVSRVRTMEDVTLAAQERPRFLSLLLTAFSCVALALAAVGIYGVMSYSVAQRTGEFGIRMAIGAQRGDVLGLVLRQGMAIGAAGVAIGAAGAFALTRFLRGLLFGVDVADPLTFALMAAALGGVTLAACYIPARRATMVDPLAALRYE